jgi:hypothetical protein
METSRAIILTGGQERGPRLACAYGLIANHGLSSLFSLIIAFVFHGLILAIINSPLF